MRKTSSGSASAGKRFTMFANALEAVTQFAAKNPTADVKPLIGEKTRVIDAEFESDDEDERERGRRRR